MTYRDKLEGMVFVDKVFLQRKISNKDVYVNYSAMADGIKDAVK